MINSSPLIDPFITPKAWKTFQIANILLWVLNDGDHPAVLYIPTAQHIFQKLKHQAEEITAKSSQNKEYLTSGPFF